MRMGGGYLVNGTWPPEMVFGFVFSTPRMARKREFRESTQISTNVKIYRKMWQWCFLKKSLVLQIRQNLKKSIASWGRKSGVFIYLFIYFFYFEIFNQGLSNPKVSLKSETLRCHTCLVCRRIAHQPSDLGYCVFILSWRNHCRHLSNRRGCQKKKKEKKKHNLEVIHSNEKRPWDYDMTLLELSALCSLRYR